MFLVERVADLPLSLVLLSKSRTTHRTTVLVHGCAGLPQLDSATGVMLLVIPRQRLPRVVQSHVARNVLKLPPLRARRSRSRRAVVHAFRNALHEFQPRSKSLQPP